MQVAWTDFHETLPYDVVCVENCKLFMSPLRRHIFRLLHGKIGFLGFFSALAP